MCTPRERDVGKAGWVPLDRIGMTTAQSYNMRSAFALSAACVPACSRVRLESSTHPRGQLRLELATGICACSEGA